MAKELRLSFAMGGSVSLASFSGAALSQCIKLAVLDQMKDGPSDTKRPYDRVVIDCFAGASGGGMSATVMLRLLLDPSDPTLRATATTLLTSEFGDAFTGISDPVKRDCLIDAQMIQDQQKAIWVNKPVTDTSIGIDRLLDPGDSGQFAPSILFRRAIDQIALNLLAKPFQVRPSKLLPSRVLVGLSLANLVPVVYDARSDFATAPGSFAGLRTAARSRCHREMRVFDIQTEPIAAANDQPGIHPIGWRRLHLGAAFEQAIDATVARGRVKVVDDLSSQDIWRQIMFTAIACGAFPFAFEPVPLRRYWYEYPGLDLPEFAASQEAEFVYFDGGTFNNQPIRDAFRLAGFIDSLTPIGDYDRKVIFVSPFNELESPKRTLPVENLIKPAKDDLTSDLSKGGAVLVSAPERLFANALTTLSALIDEGRIVEGDLIFATRHLFDQRRQFRSLLPAIVAAIPPGSQPAITASLLGFCESQLRTRRQDAFLPNGMLELTDELQRVDDELVSIDLTAIANIPGARDLLKAACLAVDLLMDLSGKDESATLIAVGPFIDMPNDPAAWPTVKGFDLPGNELEAFAGFFSPTAQAASFEIGKFCAWQALNLSNLATTPAAGRPSNTTFCTNTYASDLPAGLAKLSKRLADMIDSVDAIPEIAKPFIKSFISSKVGSLMTQPTKFVEVRIELADFPKPNQLELAGTGLTDQPPIALPGMPFVIPSVVRYDSGRWIGPHVQSDDRGQFLRVDADGLFLGIGETPFARVEFPPATVASQLTGLQDATSYTYLYASITPESKGTTVQLTVKDGLRLPEDQTATE